MAEAARGELGAHHQRQLAHGGDGDAPVHPVAPPRRRPAAAPAAVGGAVAVDLVAQRIVGDEVAVARAQRLVGRGSFSRAATSRSRGAERVPVRDEHDRVAIVAIGSGTWGASSSSASCAAAAAAASAAAAARSAAAGAPAGAPRVAGEAFRARRSGHFMFAAAALRALVTPTDSRSIVESRISHFFELRPSKSEPRPSKAFDIQRATFDIGALLDRSGPKVKNWGPPTIDN